MTRMRSIAGSRSRGGFTLVELLVTVVVIAVGLLALAGTSSTVARLDRAGAQRSTAATLAMSRLERLRAERCTPAAGTDTARGVVVHWEVHALSERLADVQSDITIAGAAGHASVIERYRSTIPC
jgi:prepilin-type N-terminal cleavage/methylation domain-containing protein